MDPIVAVYAVTVTVRAKADTAEGVPINVSAMSIAAVIEAIEAAIEEAYAEGEVNEVTVNATAIRTDD